MGMEEIRVPFLKQRKEYPIFAKSASIMLDNYVAQMIHKANFDPYLAALSKALQPYGRQRKQKWTEAYWVEQTVWSSLHRSSQLDEFVADGANKLLDGFLRMTAGDSLLKKAADKMGQKAFYDILGLQDRKNIFGRMTGSLNAHFYGYLLGWDTGLVVNFGQFLNLWVKAGYHVGPGIVKAMSEEFIPRLAHRAKTSALLGAKSDKLLGEQKIGWWEQADFVGDWTRMLGLKEKTVGGSSKISEVEDAWRNIAYWTNLMHFSEFTIRGVSVTSMMEKAIKMGLGNDPRYALPIAFGGASMFPPMEWTAAQYYGIREGVYGTQYGFDYAHSPPWAQSNLAKSGRMFWNFPGKTLQQFYNDFTESIGRGDYWQTMRLMMALGVIWTGWKFAERIGMDMRRIYSPRGIWGVRLVAPPIMLVWRSAQLSLGKTGIMNVRDEEMDRWERDIKYAMTGLIHPGYRWESEKLLPAIEMAKWKKEYGHIRVRDFKGRPLFIAEPQFDQWVTKQIGEDGILIGGIKIGGPDGIPPSALLMVSGFGLSEQRAARTDIDNMADINWKYEKREAEVSGIETDVWPYTEGRKFYESLIPGRKDKLRRDAAEWRQWKSMGKSAKELSAEAGAKAKALQSSLPGRFYPSMSAPAKGHWLSFLKKEGWRAPDGTVHKGDNAWAAWVNHNLAGEDAAAAGEYLSRFERMIEEGFQP
jgi:hypothetical protein